ncbi:YggT family protein [Phocicoccus pinnipedialis]|uniref:YGGT family protein n=1 Tax=Phocicoccus pinnipedialis TaxID=110845 RepID=A0A6V7RGQ3_9BACL|nr:YggT family protein [Jeotgalicoccus pinnipedialis]MBP1939045.1 YggT family protein [Jeotgalicoccus pinnipedialis]CAD2077030.1 YGGT family protein [Jeotgalicoccus pinnipedialis]
MDNIQIAKIVKMIFDVYVIVYPIFSWGFIIYILSSWVPGLRESKFGDILGRVYEPLLEPFRRIIPPLGGMLDLSPIAFIIVLQLFNYGMRSIFVTIINGLLT